MIDKKNDSSRLSESGESAQTLKGAAYVAAHLSLFPERPGVYRMLNGQGKILYVGKAKSLRRRLENYAHPERTCMRIQRMISEIERIEIIETKTEAEAFLLENDLIKKLKPYYNILLKDDKTFPHILITTKDEWPQMLKHRGARTKKGEYFGPFASALTVNETLAVLQKAFLLRSCTDNVFYHRTRPCLLHQIKRCSAPCAGKISKEDYLSLVGQVCDFMHNKSTRVQSDLAAKMEEASEAMRYEEAAVYRDRIRALNQIQSQSSDLDGIADCDIAAVFTDKGQSCVQMFFYRGGRSCGNFASFLPRTEDRTDGEILQAFIGQFYMTHAVPNEILVSMSLPEQDIVSQALSDKAGHAVKIADNVRANRRRLVERAVMNAKEALIRKRMEGSSRAELLEQLRELAGIKTPVRRIETYDNSHIQGAHAVGAMVVATPEGFDKKSYRKFNISWDSFTPGDDFGMMREVLTRRFKRGMEENNLPDIILIDGGEIQLKVALEVLKELNISDVVAIGVAKGEDRNAGKETLHFADRPPLKLEFDNPLLHYIQRLRDEAHRFVIGTHRIKRRNDTLVSALDSIGGIGAKRKKALLQHFGSVKAIKAVSAKEIAKVEGISPTLAQQIFDALK
ncbi:MAG: excinuclease ABC subunit UvrC [Alphaproteobacteria bacterium]|nr:excinuclease ABC subunit UvrC [Alphaproteobacteria bacterium]